MVIQNKRENPDFFMLKKSGIYGAMALAGKFICSITGVDCTGGFHPSLKAIVEGLGYAAPPIMALLFILDVCLGFLFGQYFFMIYYSVLFLLVWNW